jgi:hypothetical protein
MLYRHSAAKTLLGRAARSQLPAHGLMTLPKRLHSLLPSEHKRRMKNGFVSIIDLVPGVGSKICPGFQRVRFRNTQLLKGLEGNIIGATLPI